MFASDSDNWKARRVVAAVCRGKTEHARVGNNLVGEARAASGLQANAGESFAVNVEDGQVRHVRRR